MFLTKIQRVFGRGLANQSLRPTRINCFQTNQSRMFAQINVMLADLGEGTKEATIKEVYVKVGDRVEEYDDLMEVFTDKLTAKIPSTATGIVTAINYNADDVAAVGHPLIAIDDGVGVQAPAPVVEKAAAKAPVAAQKMTSSQVKVMLADLGEGTKEATIKEVYVKVGDRVEEYDDLMEVFTDKLTAKIPSTATGIVTAINYYADDVAAVGHPLITIEQEGGEETPAVEQAAAPVAAQKQTKSVDKATNSPPSVKRIASQNGININDVPGTGKAGRVTKTDILDFMNTGTNAKSLSTPDVRYYAKTEGININQVSGTGKNGRVTKTDILNFMNASSSVSEPEFVQQQQSTPVASEQENWKGSAGHQIAPLYGITEQDKVVKITGMKKAMTKTMTESLSIPFFTFSDEMDATKLIALRKQLKAQVPGLTMLPFFIKACSLAMSDYPLVNSHVDNDLDKDGFIQRYVIKHDHNFSIAIDSPDGLTVPAIKQVQNKSVLALNKEVKELADKAKNGGLTLADFENSTFSVSSVGNIGGRYFVPTILRPQAAIIAIGQAHKSAKYVEDDSADGYRWDPQDSINFSISADHRILDGATVARFGSRIKQLIEEPNLMLLNMS